MTAYTGEMLSFAGESAEVRAYLSRPIAREPSPAIIVIHEIWGLSEHIKSVTNRLAEQGYAALAPALFSSPDLAEVMTADNIQAAFQFMNNIQRERMGDPAYVQEELAKLPVERRGEIQRTLSMITGGIPKDKLTRDLVKAVAYLQEQDFYNGKIGSVGFCFGGGMSINLACHAYYDAAAVFYGENPSPIDLIENITCPILGIYGAEDTRINIRLDELVRAMVTYKKDFQMKLYPGAGHAFFNETNPNSYRPLQAQDAWERLLNFFGRTLTTF